jgi:hypothetical protein
MVAIGGQSAIDCMCKRRAAEPGELGSCGFIHDERPALECGRAFGPPLASLAPAAGPSLILLLGGRHLP